MELKNNNDTYVSFTVRVNPNEIVKFVDAEGISREKPAKPNIRTIIIPPLATVEIEDDVWEVAYNTMVQKNVLEVEEEVVSKDKANVLTKTEVYATGKVVRHFPIREMLENNTIMIKVEPTIKLSVAQMIERISKAQGYPMPTNVPEDKVKEIYMKIVKG